MATTSTFAFYSDFATNLNDALIAAGAARNDGEPELFHAGAEASCFSELSPAARSAWDRAVDYYAEIISPADIFDRQQYLLRADLAGFDEGIDDARARRFVRIARSLQAAATPAYEECRWARQDAENRRWIEALLAHLDAHEQAIAQQLVELYHTEWDSLPLVVDVVQTVNWSGANSIFPSDLGGHLLISTAYQGLEALEIVFHEASHGLMFRGDPLRKALAEAADTHDLRLPDDLWHVVLFYTTGEVVRRALDHNGGSSYRPIIYDIFDRGGAWSRFREPFENTWPAYIEGRQPLSEAAAHLIQAIDAPGTDNR